MSSAARTTCPIAVRHGQSAWNLASRPHGQLNVAVTNSGSLARDAGQEWIGWADSECLADRALDETSGQEA